MLKFVVPAHNLAMEGAAPLTLKERIALHNKQRQSQGKVVAPPSDAEVAGSPENKNVSGGGKVAALRAGLIATM